MSRDSESMHSIEDSIPHFHKEKLVLTKIGGEFINILRELAKGSP